MDNSNTRDFQREEEAGLLKEDFAAAHSKNTLATKACCWKTSTVITLATVNIILALAQLYFLNSAPKSQEAATIHSESIG